MWLSARAGSLDQIIVGNEYIKGDFNRTLFYFQNFLMSQSKKNKGAAAWAQQFLIDKSEVDSSKNLTELYKERFFLREWRELEAKISHRRFKKKNSKNNWKKISDLKEEMEAEFWYHSFIESLEKAKTFKELSKTHPFLKGESKRLATSSGYTDEDTYCSLNDKNRVNLFFVCMTQPFYSLGLFKEGSLRERYTILGASTSAAKRPICWRKSDSNSRKYNRPRSGRFCFEFRREKLFFKSISIVQPDAARPIQEWPKCCFYLFVSSMEYTAFEDYLNYEDNYEDSLAADIREFLNWTVVNLVFLKNILVQNIVSIKNQDHSQSVLWCFLAKA